MRRLARHLFALCSVVSMATLSPPTTTLPRSHCTATVPDCPRCATAPDFK